MEYAVCKGGLKGKTNLFTDIFKKYQFEIEICKTMLPRSELLSPKGFTSRVL